MKKRIQVYLCNICILVGLVFLPTQSLAFEISEASDTFVPSSETPEVPNTPILVSENDETFERIVTSNAEYSYQNMLDDLNLLEEAHPFLQVEALDDGVKNKIYKITLGNGEKKVLISNSFTAKDWNTTLYTMQMLEQYAQAYANDAEIDGVNIKQMLDHISFVFIPTTAYDLKPFTGGANRLTVDALNATFRHDYIPVKTERRSGSSLIGPQFIVAHDTGNNNSTAKNNVDYYKNSANSVSASAHIFVDNKESVLTIPLNEKAWHVRYNVTTDNRLFGYNANDAAIGIELCYFSGDYSRSLKAYQNYVKVIANLCTTYELDPSTKIVGHEELDPTRRTDPTNALKRIKKSKETLIRDVKKVMGTGHVPIVIHNEIETDNYVYSLDLTEATKNTFVFSVADDRAKYTVMRKYAGNLSEAINLSIHATANEKYMLRDSDGVAVPQLKFAIKVGDTPFVASESNEFSTLGKTGVMLLKDLQEFYPMEVHEPDQLETTSEDTQDAKQTSDAALSNSEI